MEHSVVFAGFGGQGLLFAGQAFARAAIKDGLEVFWIPSYGPEMRGGTASCTVIVGDSPIGSPVVDRFDAAVVMNLPSLRKFAPRVAPAGLLLMNTSLLGDEYVGRHDLSEMHLQCAEVAAAGGDDKLVSVAALGALVARTGWVSPGSVRAALREMAGKKRPEVVEADLGVFEAGLAAGAAAGADPSLKAQTVERDRNSPCIKERSRVCSRGANRIPSFAPIFPKNCGA